MGLALSRVHKGQIRGAGGGGGIWAYRVGFRSSGGANPQPQNSGVTTLKSNIHVYIYICIYVF